MTTSSSAAQRPLEGEPDQRLDSMSIDNHAPVFPAAMIAAWTTPRRQPPRFGDLIWETSGLQSRPVSRCFIDFTDLDPHWALLAREIIWWRMNGTDLAREHMPAALAAGRPAIKASAMEGIFQAFRHLARAADELALGMPITWTETDTDRLRSWVQANYPRAYMATAVKSLHALSPLLTIPGLKHDPVGDSLYEWSGSPTPSNVLTGMALPPAVFAPLLRSAIAYVENYSLDILAADAYRRDLEQARQNKSLPRKKTNLPVAERFDPIVRGETMNDLLRFVDTHGALPASTVDFGRSRAGELSFRTLAAALALPGNSPSEPVKQCAQQMVDSGTPLAPGMLPLTVSPVERRDGSTGPWRLPFCWTSIITEVRNLRDACIIVILAFTAMRKSEVAALERGKWRTTWHGHPAITSQLIKHHGEDAKWWATDIVIRACELLELTAVDDDSPFLLDARVERPMTAHQPDPAQAAEDTNPLDADDEEHGTVIAINNALNRFVDTINHSPALLTQDPIPATTIKPHALRHTLCSIANFAILGDLVMQQQCKHARATITWGYMNNAGTDAWTSLLVDAKAHRGLDVSLSIMTGVWSGTDEPNGPAGRRLARDIRAALDRFGADEFDPTGDAESVQFVGIVATNAELAAYARAIAHDLHPGVLNGCHGDRDKGLCGDNPIPLLSQCVTEKCGNVVLDAAQTEMFTSLRDEVQQMLQDRRVKGNQRALLEARLADLNRQLGATGEDI